MIAEGEIRIGSSPRHVPGKIQLCSEQLTLQEPRGLRAFPRRNVLRSFNDAIQIRRRDDDHSIVIGEHIVVQGQGD